MKLGFLTACLPRPLARPTSRRGLPRTASRPWRSQPGPTWAHRPFTATHLEVDGFGQRAGRRTEDSVRPAWADAVVAGLSTTTTCTPTRPNAKRSTTTSLPSSTPPRCWSARPWAPSSAATPARRSRRTCATPRKYSRRWWIGPGKGRQGDHRELRDGGLASRRLSRQPGLLPGAVGVDVLARACT